MTLETGKTYMRGDGKQETIGGITRDYKDWYWSISGNWYRYDGRAIGYTVDQKTGAGTSIVSPPTWRDLVAEVEQTA